MRLTAKVWAELHLQQEKRIKVLQWLRKKMFSNINELKQRYKEERAKIPPQ